jgi:hypothetical protein
VTPGRPLALRLLGLGALAISTASCSPTTYDTSITTHSLAPTTTVLPVGTAADLLPQLVTVAAGLSALIADQGDKFAAVERIEALWAAVQAEVAHIDPASPPRSRPRSPKAAPQQRSTGRLQPTRRTATSVRW